MSWPRTGWIGVAVALAVLLALPGTTRSQDSGGGALPDIESTLTLPPYEGERRECIADALSEYEAGHVEKAWKAARTVTRRRFSRSDDRDAAQAFIDFLDGLGEKALAVVDRYLEAGNLRGAATILERTEERFGRHEAGKTAKSKLRDLQKEHGDRLDAQELLEEIEQLLHDNEPDRAKSRFARMERRFPDLPETASARDRIAGFDPAEAERRLALQYAFGTVTPSERIPGKLDCKGSCSQLTQGGYMKFDLSEHPAGTTFRSGTLRVYVEKWSGNHWRWLTHIPSDPTKSDAPTLFREIRAQSTKFSGVITLRQPSGWLDVRLNRAAIDAINEALANTDPAKRWIAIAFGFE